tara:strand:- start:3061 stop:4185 length:1125 start_codon:yes stop_codon:yes gene_type:complete
VTTFSNTQPQQVFVTAFSEHPQDAISKHMKRREVSVPDVNALKSTDVVVAIRSSAVGWVDLLMTSGLYQHSLQPPYTPGLEYSGVVEWVGSDVTQTSVGEKVIVDAFVSGPRTSGDYQKYGGFASYAVAPQEAIHAMPKGFSFDQGCHFLGNYETAYHCLIACGELKAGETVLIHGASGSTGLAAVHLAKLVGATVIATGRSEEKLAVVKEQGADHVIHTKDPETGGLRSFRKEVKALTGGRGVDVVYDPVGGPISEESMRSMCFGGRFLVVGWASTPFVAKGEKGKANPNQLPTNLIMMKGLKVLGCPAVISAQKDPSIRVKRLQDLLAWAGEGNIQPYVSDVFSFEDYREALLHKWRSKSVGGCVLRVSTDV